eukprot:GEMP01075394.1.p1 GENE.GEMP01075394.1~~GEMP01075394.1.p1  ORF type:complete len:185 (-),score=34.15 GEMP01075394.1:364-918(-)
MWGEIAFAVAAALFLSFHSSPPVLPKFTMSEMQEYVNGEDEDYHHILAVYGFVFNVSSGADFYAEGAKYQQFRGHDCTRAFAMSSLDVDDLDGDLEGLSETEINRVEDSYRNTYLAKYPVIAEITDPPYDVKLRPSRNAPGILGSRNAEANHGLEGECPFTKSVKKIKDVLVSLLPPLLNPGSA